MYPTYHDLSAASEYFIDSRRASRVAVRFGQPAGPLVAVGAIAGGFAKLAASVERWARGTGNAERATEVAAPKRTVAGW